MSPTLVPTVDSGNPMYCPDVPAARYLRRLQQMKHPSRHSGPESFSHRVNPGSHLPLSRPIEVSTLEEVTCNQTLSTYPTQLSFKPLLSSLATDMTQLQKRKREVDFRALCYPSKRILSDISQTSFVLSPAPKHPRLPSLLRAANTQDSSDGLYQDLLKAKLQMPMNASRCSPRRFFTLESELYGRAIGTEEPEDVSQLLEDLSRELPGISLIRQLYHLERISHQDIVDILGKTGHLARHILEYFRGSLVQFLDLSASLLDEDGLNMLKPEVVLSVFALPHSFTRLRKLNLNYVTLDDFDLTRIHHLPSLDSLFLNDTGIGNEAVGHLTALKYQLTELHIENNARINDDCISSLCLFLSLTLLRTYGTNIQMPGLRKLASSVKKSKQDVDIEIPHACDTYLNNLHSHYQLHPSAPLITNPRFCTSLSPNALKANLAAHAVFNPSIFLSGSKLELADRLQGILERRLADLVVKEVVWGYESSNASSCGGDGSIGSESE